MAPGEIDALLKRANPEYPPNMLAASFSGNARAVWFFPSPLPVFDRKSQKAMIARFKKELKLKKLLPGLDEEALERPSKYYHCGDGWRVVHNSLMPVDLLQAWAIQASKATDWHTLGDVIPIERIADEVEKRFPGRWPGPFEEGARGPRFWDESADSPGAAIVRPTGMQCFTGPKPFVTWAEIFGRKFTNAFRASTIGAAIDGTWFDGLDYWLQVGGVWRPFKKPDVSLHLRVAHSISDERAGKKPHHPWMSRWNKFTSTGVSMVPHHSYSSVTI